MKPINRARFQQYFCTFAVAILAASFATSAVAAKRSNRGDSWGGTSSSCKSRRAPPVIDGLPTFSLMEGGSYQFTPTASDPNCDPLKFSISGKPSWASFNAADGTLSGQPPAGSAGSYSGISISVSDGRYQASLPTFTITVYGDRAPVLSGTPSGKAWSGQKYSFVPIAFDPDGQTLRFSVSNKPAWASFSSSTGELSGTPGDSQRGTYGNIGIAVTDGIASAALAPFSIVVEVGNRAPSISGTPSTSVVAGQAYAFTPSATDPDGNPLTFSISNKPAWANFDSATGRLAGMPSVSNVGTFSNITISVSDGTATTSLPTFGVVVSAANRAPTISGSPGNAVTSGKAYAFTPAAADEDKDPLTFSIVNKPTWASFSTATGSLSGTPATSAAGEYIGIVISVSDGKASASLPAFSIVVSTANRAPTITGTPATAVTAGKGYLFAPRASDADGDALTFSIVNKPTWASFSVATGELSGTPGTGSTGTYSGIMISVSDGTLSASLPSFSVAVEQASMGSATLSWQAPAQRTDGSLLTDLAGYRILYGSSPGSYPNRVTVNNPGLTSYVVDNLAQGTWYFVMTAFDASGAESDYSSVGSKTIQ